MIQCGGAKMKGRHYRVEMMTHRYGDEEVIKKQYESTTKKRALQVFKEKVAIYEGVNKKGHRNYEPDEDWDVRIEVYLVHPDGDTSLIKWFRILP